MTAQWDRQEGETPKAYAAFCVYRDLGVARSILDAAKVSKKCPESALEPPSHFKRWSSKYNWVARTEAFDAHQERLARDAEEAANRAVQHGIIGRRVKAKQVRIDASNALLLKGLALLDELNPKDAAWRDVTNMIRVAQEQLRKDYESEKTDEEHKDAMRDIVDERLKELADASPTQLADAYRDVLAAARAREAQEASK